MSPESDEESKKNDKGFFKNAFGKFKDKICPEDEDKDKKKDN